MKHLKPILFIAFLVSSSLSYAQWKNKKIKGNGEIATVTRTTTSYDAIKCAGPMDFKLVSGEEGTISITGDSNLLEYIVAEVKKGKLIVKVKKGFNLKPRNYKSIEVTIPVESVNAIALAGSGDLTNEGVLKGERIDVALSGSGDITLNMTANNVQSNIAGSGDIKLSGTATSLKTKVSGSGDFDGFELKSINVEANIAGSGDVKVYCSGNLKAKVSGSGDIRYRGNPNNKETKVSGSGSISSK